MPDERGYAQAKAILQGALDVPRDERSAYLDKACGGDTRLLADVRSLLAAYDEADSSFLASPLASDTSDSLDGEIPEPDLTGRRVGAYRLERLLGRGGMGAVYLASRDDGEFTKHVAIKFVRPSMVVPSGLKRFRVERQLLADIDHPRIARLIDGGTAEGGLPFFIMEYVPGETLAQILTRGPLPESRVVQLATGVAEVLEAVHSKGLVFRDLKPSNIMLSEQAGVKVLDFGIAKFMGGADEDDPTEMAMTGPGRAIGSPRYMSPEQASAERVDARSDIFSFGVVLYEALTGRLPFDGESRRDYFFNLTTAKPKPLPDTVPAGLRAVVERCLRKSPGRRYASGKELLEALREFTGTITVIERPAPARTMWAAVAALAVAAAAFVVWGLRGPEPGDGALFKAAPKFVASWASNETNPRISPDLKWISFISNRDGPTQLWLVDRASGVERSIVPPGGEIGSHVWSPSSDRIAYVAPAGVLKSLTIVPISGDRSQLFELREPVTNLVRWIGNGIYYLAAQSLWRFDLTTRNSKEVTTARGALNLRGVDVSADETRIVFAADAGTMISLWSAALDGSKAVRLTDTRMDPKYPKWKGASAREVVYVSEEGGMVDIWQADVNTRQRQRLTVTDAREGALEASANGEFLVYGQIRETAHLAVLDPALPRPSITQLTSDTLNDVLPDVSDSNREVVFQRSTMIDTALRIGMSRATVQLSPDFFRSPSAKLGDGYAPEISHDGRWVSYSVWKPSLAELWLVDTQGKRPVLVSESFLQFSFNPFPLSRTTTNLAWSLTKPEMYFLARGKVGAEVWSATPTGSGQAPKVDQITSLRDEAALLSDVQVSGDGTRLSYVLRSDERAVSELHLVDIPRKRDSVAFRETARFRLASPGWTADDGVVVLRTDRTLTDVLVIKDGRVGEAGRLLEATRGSVTLDSERRVLYFVRLVGQARSLHALSLATGQTRKIFEGEPHGPAFSGIRVLGDGRLLFSFQSQNHDIVWSEFGK